MLGGFHKIKDKMLVSMTLYIFRGTSPSSGVQMYIYHFLLFMTLESMLEIMLFYCLSRLDIVLNSSKKIAIDVSFVTLFGRD